MLFQYCDGLIDLMHIFAVLIYQFGVWRSPVSAPGLGPGGRRFESCHPDTIVKAIAIAMAFFVCTSWSLTFKAVVIYSWSAL